MAAESLEPKFFSNPNVDPKKRHLIPKGVLIAIIAVLVVVGAAYIWAKGGSLVPPLPPVSPTPISTIDASGGAQQSASPKPNPECGGIAGLACSDGYTCQMDANYPDAGGTCVKDEQKVCIQVITPATNPKTGESKDFPTPCDVPQGWLIKTDSGVQ